MILLVSVLSVLGVILYIVGAGATHGYGKHRWPADKKWSYYYNNYTDSNSGYRIWAAFFWPFYWAFIWPFTKINEVTFSHVEKSAAHQVAQNKIRIADLQATKAELEASNAELETAELELEKEMAKL